MNLGNFVGGAVQGFNAQERTNIASREQQANQGFRERTMKIAENEEAAKVAARDREKAMRDESSSLFNKYYGEQQETVAETKSEDGQGNLASIPTVKVARKQPGLDAAHDNKWRMEHAMLIAKHEGASPEKMAATVKQMEDALQTETGKSLNKVLSGDESALGAFLKSIGKDPKGAKLDNRPADGIRQIVLADGSTPLDLRKAFQFTANAAQYKALLDEEGAARDVIKDKASTRNLNATAGAHEAEASLIPLKGNLLKAQAGAAGAQGNLANAKAQAASGGGGAVDKKALAAAEKTLVSDPTYKMYEPASRSTVGLALAASLRNGTNPQQAAKDAIEWHEQMLAKASAALKKTPQVGPNGKKVTASEMVAAAARKHFGGAPTMQASEEEVTE